LFRQLHIGMGFNEVSCYPGSPYQSAPKQLLDVSVKGRLKRQESVTFRDWRMSPIPFDMATSYAYLRFHRLPQTQGHLIRQIPVGGGKCRTRTHLAFLLHRFSLALVSLGYQISIYPSIRSTYLFESPSHPRIITKITTRHKSPTINDAVFYSRNFLFFVLLRHSPIFYKAIPSILQRKETTAIRRRSTIVVRMGIH
jgi:hypothetical protein